MCKLNKTWPAFICTIPFCYRYVNILLENKTINCYTFKGIFLFSCVHLHHRANFLQCETRVVIKDPCSKSFLGWHVVCSSCFSLIYILCYLLTYWFTCSISVKPYFKQKPFNWDVRSSQILVVSTYWDFLGEVKY